MTDVLMLGALIGAVAMATPAVYLAVRIALAELPERPVELPPVPIDVHPELAAAADDVIARAQAYEAQSQRELELMRLERATFALQPFGWFHVAGRCRQ